METFARPLSTSVPAQPLSTQATARPAEQPVSASTPTRAVQHQQDEHDDQAKRDFYAWCSGCEGFGSIF